MMHTPDVGESTDAEAGVATRLSPASRPPFACAVSRVLRRGLAEASAQADSLLPPASRRTSL